MQSFKVSSKSNSNSVAGALAAAMRVNDSVAILTVGAGALNQAIKAIAIARGFLISSSIDIFATPSFTEIDIDGEIRTGITLLIEKRDYLK